MKSKETHKFTAFCVSMCMGVSMFSGFAVSADEPETTPNAPASTVWKVSADTATAGNSTYVDDDNLTVKSTQDGTKVAATAATIGGVDYTNYLQVRVQNNPWDGWATYSDGATATSLLVTPKTDGTLTVAYRRQSTDKTATGYASADGKDIKLSKANAEGTYTSTLESSTAFDYAVLSAEKVDYAYATQSFALDANTTYQLWARNTTIQFYGLTYTVNGAAVASPEATTETSPEATIETSPEATIETSPEATIETSPEATTETSPEATTETSPEATTETSPEATTEASPAAKALELNKVLTASDLTDNVTANTEEWDVTDTSYSADYEKLGKPFGELTDFAATYTSQANFVDNTLSGMTVEIPTTGEYTVNLLFREYSNRGFTVTFDNGTDEPKSVDIFSDKKVAKYSNYTVTSVSNTISLEEGSYNVTITGTGRDTQVGKSGSNLFAMSIVSPAITPVESSTPAATATAPAESAAPSATATAPAESSAPSATATAPAESAAPSATATAPAESAAPSATATAPAESSAPAAKALAVNKVLTAPELTDSLIDVTQTHTWNVANEDYIANYEAMGAPFGALADFANTYTKYVDFGTSKTMSNMTINVPTSGEYTVNLLFRQYDDRGFKITFTDSDNKATSVDIISGSERIAVLNPAEGNAVNMTAASEKVTLAEGEYDVTIEINNNGSFLFAASIMGSSTPSESAAPSATATAPAESAAPSATATAPAESSAPATDVPATDVPATDAPATDAPATDAPAATDSPESDSVTTTTSSTIITVTNALNGYEYALYDSNGNVVRDWTSSASGTISFRNLSLDTTYQLRFRSTSEPDTVYTKTVSTTAGGRTSGGGGGGGVSTYTVSFNTNGGSSISSTRVTSGSRLSEPTAPTRSGYTFAGWYTDRALTDEYDFDSAVYKSFTLYAAWTEGTATTAPTEAPSNQMILTIGSTQATVWGKTVNNDVAPKIVNDRTMLPARFIVESLGGTITWDGDNQQVTIVQDDTTIVITIGASTALVNGESVALDSPAFIENDRTYMPIRFISENLGADVDWDEDGQQVIITRN